MIGNAKMDLLDKLGYGADIDALESHVAELQDAMAAGHPLLTDTEYDIRYNLLKELKPESKVLSRNWEAVEEELNDYDELLKKYGMCSILTIQDVRDLGYFASMLGDIGEPVDMIASLKENGYGVREVYRYGVYQQGSLRGRYKKGQDRTRHLGLITPSYVEKWKDIPLAEVRGELVVDLNVFHQKLEGIVKTPLSAITSLSRESASDEEIKLMEFVAYKVVFTDEFNSEIKTLSEEMENLESAGFKVPEHISMKNITRGNLVNSVLQILSKFEAAMDGGYISHYCDGIVFAIDNRELFYSLGKNGNAFKANFALKAGKYWECNTYSAIIEEVVFERGKTFRTPKAIIVPTVVANGNTVETVPLYNVGVMERYGYTTGATLYFKYGGETGVTLCDAMGESVKVQA